MAEYKVVNTDFSGGLMSPYLRGRIDIDKYVKGSQKMDNFIPQIQGPAHYREGFEWIKEAYPTNTQLVAFSINADNRYLLVLSARRLQVYDTTTKTLVATRGDGTSSSEVPYKGSQVKDVRYTREVEEMIFTHPEHPPYRLRANTVFETTQLLDSGGLGLNTNDGFTLYSASAGAGGLTPWDFSLVDFTSHPYKKVDKSGNVLRMEPTKEVVRLESTNSSEFTYTPAEIAEMPTASTAHYVEYQVANQWSLARVLTTTPNNEGVVAPADPSGSVCYVDPVDSVVNIKDPSVRLLAITGNSANAPWTIKDRVPNGDTHVRADALIFETSHINSWVRVGGDKLFTNVPNRSGTSDEDYNSQDGKVRWGRIVDYRGVEDHPVDFVYDSLRARDYESGAVYQVYQFDDDDDVTGIGVFDGTGFGIADRTAFVNNSNASTRFAMNVAFRVGGSNSDVAGQVNPVYPYTGLLIANMSTQRQFDVVEVEDVKVEDDRFRSPNGTVSVYDLITDPEKQASHTTVVRASQSGTFSSSRDEGRYIQGNLGDGWVTLKITSVTNSRTATCDVLSNVPLDELTGDILNDGVFLAFRLGSWFTGNWPSAVSYYEQRRVFAGTVEDPNLVWLSKTDDDLDFRTVEDDGKVLDTTGITYPLGTSSTIIRWLESGPTLIAGTESNEWQLRPNEFSAAITPSNIRITQETDIGSTVQGIRIGSSVFFPRIGGKSFTEFRFDFQSQQFVTQVTTKLVPDLFEDDRIVSFAYQHTPNSSMWLVTSAGRLITLTYRKEDDYYAWAEHPTTGRVKEVEVVAKGDTSINEDQVWIQVERNGEFSLELLGRRFTDDGSDNLKEKLNFLDSSSRFPREGYEPQSDIYVPTRFGDSVDTVVDGVYLGKLPVDMGVLQLPEGVTIDHYCLIGFQYEGNLQPMPQAWTVSDGNAYGRRKKLISLRPYLRKSMGFDIGFDAEEDFEHVRGTNDGDQPMGESPYLYTGFTEKVVNPCGSNFDVDKAPIIRQSEPYPLDVVSVIYHSDLKE